jgi:chromosome segregation ATPase
LGEFNFLDKEAVKKVLVQLKVQIDKQKEEISKLEEELTIEKEKNSALNFQNKYLENKISKMNDEIIKQADVIETLKEERKKLLNVINDFKKNIDKISDKKDLMKKNIDEVLEISNISQAKMEEILKSSNINDIEVEMKIFLKGMFHKFIKEKNALEILIEGKKYYYPLSSYQCTHLPVSGSRVLVFKSEDDRNIIFGFHGPRLIDIAKKLKAEIKFISRQHNRLKLYIEEKGFINFAPEEDFWDNHNYKIGDKVILTEINIELDKYYYISSEYNSTADRLKVLEFLGKES